ncbi:MAG TPA: hypothetical protein PKA37_05275, partial [Planctomycetota bacterium]|nr:hypothetical protein [Planctomycetota bacterium]
GARSKLQGQALCGQNTLDHREKNERSHGVLLAIKRGSYTKRAHLPTPRQLGADTRATYAKTLRP